MSQEDIDPLPPEPIGPRGMPAFTPITAAGNAAAVGKCTGILAAERDHETYAASEMKRGSAKILRGRVAILELRVASANGEPWSRIALRHADAEAADTRAFLLDEAAHQGITDLSIDVLPWFVTTELPAVKLVTDDRGRADGPSADAVRNGAFEHVGRATGVDVSSVVTALRKDGYTEVAVLLRVPSKTISREFAMWGTPDGIDSALLQQTPAIKESGTYAHELLHLFGADDLYRLTKSDPQDSDDIMGAECGGLHHARIGDATAWAIGWRATPPERVYAFASPPKPPVEASRKSRR